MANLSVGIPMSAIFYKKFTSACSFERLEKALAWHFFLYPTACKDSLKYILKRNYLNVIQQCKQCAWIPVAM